MIKHFNQLQVNLSTFVEYLASPIMKWH